MRYILDIERENVARIKQLIDGGKYDSVHSFLLTSIENQLYLETQRSDARVSTGDTNKSLMERYSYLLGIFNVHEVKTVAPPADEKLNIHYPIWGLANRIFPAKITLRVLSNMLTNNGKFVDFQPLIDNAFEAACVMGLKLKNYDDASTRKRGDRLSDALPTNPKDKKAKNRFESQFVGRLIYKTGRLSGAPPKLKFIDILVNNEGKEYVGITDKGLEFALLENPILDKETHDQTLSQNESKFLLQHILEELPGERRAIEVVINSVYNEKSTPSELTNVIKSTFGKDEIWSSTVRVGVTSRLVELGVLRRSKKGVNIRYLLTEFGENQLGKFTKDLPTSRRVID